MGFVIDRSLQRYSNTTTAAGASRHTAMRVAQHMCCRHRRAIDNRVMNTIIIVVVIVAVSEINHTIVIVAATIAIVDANTFTKEYPTFYKSVLLIFSCANFIPIIAREA
uniref:Cadherin-20 n=1 Tax=Lygus hesperus TaxID=30085 RepID=A0A0A9XTH4_LYGHE